MGKEEGGKGNLTDNVIIEDTIVASAETEINPSERVIGLFCFFFFFLKKLKLKAVP